MVIKIKSERKGEQVYDRIFVGPDEEHLALTGILVLYIGEWQEFGAALLLGAKQMHGRVQVILEGDDEVVGR